MHTAQSLRSARRPVIPLPLEVTQRLHFLDDPSGSFKGVEFETAPTAVSLAVISVQLSTLRVCIADSSTRLTRYSLYQRFELSERDGSPLLGARRREVEQLFREALPALPVS
jgi:hypothetical protein